MPDIFAQLEQLKAISDKRKLITDELKAINDKREGGDTSPGLVERAGNLMTAAAKLEAQEVSARKVDPDALADLPAGSLEAAPGAAGHKALGANPLSYDPRALDAIQDAIVTRAYKQVSADFKEGR